MVFVVCVVLGSPLELAARGVYDGLQLAEEPGEAWDVLVGVVLHGEFFQGRSVRPTDALLEERLLLPNCRLPVGCVGRRGGGGG